MVGWSAQVRERVLDAVWAGSTASEAARSSGVHVATVCRWVQAAGMRLVPGGPGGLASHDCDDPRDVAGRLRLADRVLIQVRLADGKTPAAIAREVGVHRSTICREIARNRGSDGTYLACRAQRQAVIRRSRPKPHKLDHLPLRQAVIDGLNQRWSPEQIAARLAKQVGCDQTMRVSHETIYQSLYVQGKGALRQELKVAKALRSGRTGRKPQSLLPARAKRPWITEHNRITQRPAEAADRAVPGHWEGDLVIGGGLKSALITLVERSTRFALIGRIDTHDTDTVAEKLSQMIQDLPAQLRRSLTWDQGIEMGKQASFQIAQHIPVYFCDPHSPWQRGSNENLNGLIRDFYPKGTDFSKITDTQIAEMQHLLNTRPRLTLNADTPAERLNTYINNVALTA